MEKKVNRRDQLYALAETQEWHFTAAYTCLLDGEAYAYIVLDSLAVVAHDRFDFEKFIKAVSPPPPGHFQTAYIRQTAPCCPGELR